jgi:hypothetical protein
LKGLLFFWVLIGAGTRKSVSCTSPHTERRATVGPTRGWSSGWRHAHIAGQTPPYVEPRLAAASAAVARAKLAAELSAAAQVAAAGLYWAAEAATFDAAVDVNVLEAAEEAERFAQIEAEEQAQVFAQQDALIAEIEAENQAQAAAQQAALFAAYEAEEQLAQAAATAEGTDHMRSTRRRRPRHRRRRPVVQSMDLQQTQTEPTTSAHADRGGFAAATRTPTERAAHPPPKPSNQHPHRLPLQAAAAAAAAASKHRQAEAWPSTSGCEDKAKKYTSIQPLHQHRGRSVKRLVKTPPNPRPKQATISLPSPIGKIVYVDVDSILTFLQKENKHQLDTPVSRMSEMTSYIYKKISIYFSANH